MALQLETPAEVLVTLNNFKPPPEFCLISGAGEGAVWTLGKSWLRFAFHLSQLIVAAYTLSSLSPWAKSTILGPFSEAGRAMWQRVALTSVHWHRLDSWGRAGG